MGAEGQSFKDAIKESLNLTPAQRSVNKSKK